MKQTNEKLAYKATELAEMLGISRSSAYDLMHRHFPTIRIGKRLLVNAEQLRIWLTENTGGNCVENSSEL